MRRTCCFKHRASGPMYYDSYMGGLATKIFEVRGSDKIRQKDSTSAAIQRDTSACRADRVTAGKCEAQLFSAYGGRRENKDNRQQREPDYVPQHRSNWSDTSSMRQREKLKGFDAKWESAIMVLRQQTYL
jgi:hypothetical protein